MKTPREPSQPSPDESRRTNVLFEKLMSEFRTFGEGQSIMRERLDRMEPDLHAVKEDVAVLKSVVRSHTDDLRAIKSDVAVLKDDMSVLKADVSDIKTDLKKYNQRLEVVETRIAS